jgi:hypothetical protein
MHRARVAAHRVGPRYVVPAVDVEVPAVSIEHARALAVGEAHRRAEVPPWRPWIRESLRYATADRVSAPAAVVTLPRQLELGRAA